VTFELVFWHERISCTDAWLLIKHPVFPGLLP
jgi:hypothetical protein